MNENLSPQPTATTHADPCPTCRHTFASYVDALAAELAAAEFHTALGEF